MYKEIDEMNKEELANLIALTKKIGSQEDLKRTSQDLTKRFTPEGLRLELWEWITRKEHRELSDYKDEEAGALEKISKMWKCEKSLSLAKTEEKITEEVLLKIVESLSLDQREKLAKALEEKGDLPEKDMNEIKQLLLAKGKIVDISLLVMISIIRPIIFVPPLTLKGLLALLLLKWIANRRHRKFVLGIIVALCVMKRLEKKK